MARVAGGRPVKSPLQQADGYLDLRMAVIEKERKKQTQEIYKVKQIEHGNMYIPHIHVTYISHTYICIYIYIYTYRIYIYIFPYIYVCIYIYRRRGGGTLLSNVSILEEY